MKTKRRKEEGGRGREGVGFRAQGCATVYCLTGVLCFPQLPCSKISASEVTGKRLCVATNRTHCCLMTPGLPWSDTHAHTPVKTNRKIHTHTHTHHTHLQDTASRQAGRQAALLP